MIKKIQEYLNEKTAFHPDLIAGGVPLFVVVIPIIIGLHILWYVAHALFDS